MNSTTDGWPAERRAAWILARARRPRFLDRVKLVEATGSCVAALAELGPAVAPRERVAGEKELERAARRGFSLVALTEPGFPRLLRHVPDPPLALWVWGRLLPEDAFGLAVVGSRRASPYGLAAARRLSRDLARRGLTIVSGLARGIDAQAHRGALEAGGRTVAVLGSGLGNLYPREHRKLAEAIAENGAVVSELDLDEPPRGANFPRRNRIITGSTLGTLVVEATLKSGSLVSAHLALDQNREVFCVPGPIGVETSLGVHDLIRAGARLVASAEDLLDDLPMHVRAAICERAASRPDLDEHREGEAIDADERSVLEAMTRNAERALDVDDILERVSLTVDRVLAALSRLEIRKRVTRHPGGFFRME